MGRNVNLLIAKKSSSQKTLSILITSQKNASLFMRTKYAIMDIDVNLFMMKAEKANRDSRNTNI